MIHAQANLVVAAFAGGNVIADKICLDIARTEELCRGLRFGINHSD